jgi:uncharacterized protein YdeI (YjbR/CyaY-like superfamily)
MGTKNPKIDAYIAKSAEFAKPILTHIRALVHKACPDVEEELKWGHPFFIYKGMLCAVPAFKQHCRFGFWDWKLVKAKVDAAGGKQAAGLVRMERIRSVADLPDKETLLKMIQVAVELKDAGIKTKPRPKPKARLELVVPECLAAALKKYKQARETFEKFSYSHKKEYIEWIADAKSEETRNRRLATAIEWLTEGKSRNWKYMNCGEKT